MQPSSAPLDSAASAATDVHRLRAGRWLIAALVAVLIVGLINIAAGPGLEPTDAWVAQTAREMSESTDWRGYVVPHFSGEVRMQKSPGPYWLVNAIAAIRGVPIDLVSLRIPNVGFALLVVCVAYWLAREIAGQRAAAFAAVTAASTGIVLAWTSRGASDFGLSALMALSLASLWIATEKREPGWRRTALWMLGYFAAGLAMLYKMPMPLVCIGLPVVIYLLIMRRLAILADWRHLVGLALFALPWMPWAIVVTQLEPQALYKWKVEYVDRMTGELPNYEEQRVWLTYLYYPIIALGFCLPYSLSLVGALAMPFRRETNVDRRGVWFLHIWFWSLLLFFTLSGGKENRYFLPMLLPLLVLLGGELSAFFHPQRRANATIEKWLPWLLGLAIPIGCAVALMQLRKKWLPHVADLVLWNDVVLAVSIAGGVLTVMVVACTLALSRRREAVAFWSLAVGTWALWVWTAGMVVPTINPDSSLRSFARDLREKLSPEQRAVLRQVAQQDPRVIWHSDVRFPRVVDQLKLLEMQGGKRSREFEVRKIGETVIDALAAPPLSLFVATAVDYLTFELQAPGELARVGREMPPRYLWLTSATGRLDQKFVVFGNQPPPWPQPILPLPEKFAARVVGARAQAAQQLAERSAASQPSSQSTSTAPTSVQSTTAEVASP
ncbi:MAG: ArnT family glycosyltransferase [Phycisphaerae bacterium]